MQNVMVNGDAGGVLIGTNLTRYLPITGDETVTPTEAAVQTRLRDSLTWSRLRAYVQANSFAAGNNTTITARVNGVDNTTLQLTIDGGVTGEVEDLTGSISLVTADLINYKIITPNVAGSIAISFYESLLDGTVGIFQVCSAARTTLAASTTYYSPLDGALFATSWTTEAWAQMATRETVTLDRLRGYLASVGTGGSVTITTRKGGVNGAQSIAWTGTTGEQEDTTNSDSAASGDLWNYSVANTNTAGTSSLSQIQMRHGGAQSFLGCVNRDALTIGSGTTNDMLPEGELLFSATEAQAQVDANATRVIKNMRVYVSANTINGTTTLTLRKDGVDTAIAVSYGASTTGVQEDLVDSVTYTAAQEMSTRIVTGGTMNTMVPRFIQYTQEDEAGGVVNDETGGATTPAVASGADQTLFAETATPAAPGVASGADQFTATETATPASPTVTDGADQPVFSETATPASPAVADGADQTLFAETATPASPAVADGADQTTFAEQGTPAAPAVASGADQLTTSETGTPAAPAVASGEDQVIYSEQGTPAAPAVASGTGTKQLTSDEIGTGVTPAVASGADQTVFAEQGTGAAPGVADGTDQPVFGETATPVASAVADGADQPVYSEIGTGVSPGVAGGASTQITSGETGGAVSPAVASGADQIVWVETATPAIPAVADGADQTVFGEIGAGTATMQAGGVAELISPPGAGGGSHTWIPSLSALDILAMEEDELRRKVLQYQDEEILLMF